MKTLTLSLVLFLFYGFSLAQEDEFTPPRFVKQPIENTGCYAYFPNDVEMVFDLSYSPDSSKVYTGDFLSGNFHYSIILVQLKDLVMQTTEEKDDMLVSYLDYLQGTVGIVGSAGYGKGHTMESNPSAVGIIDYWEDDEGDQWSVKAWADGSTMAILFIYGATEYPSYGAGQLFLNGFRFN
ncbi:MAG: hypothetical protein A3D31_13815 [Candidatus Fluviicola riflensis]|nr:MAG: hypothetical protein CHH17_18250 [Candidatus Fluviicola riflensis]OGS78054.1 MAG: hypothetical protein A3D31_13815 [Candidatus Fluviicola riflensis]OGS85119.1 MAG: hypothetical protein A2724_10750 [Fluviicola sp. RIFCSPHIGHO2_01_FULL_43_53]OGS89391.1 MAG: hypothetical protein A3E30_05055 [Fluviicola sp. RIFCSPHIGHO2_12_FULL_43_24]